MVVAVGNKHKQNAVFIHCLMQINLDYTEREQIKTAVLLIFRPDWLRIYSYSRFSKTTTETGPADNRNSQRVRSEQK
jgi:hypothetical protein